MAHSLVISKVEKHNISSLSESVVASTGGRPVVPDTTLGQYVECVGPSVKRSHVMFNSSRALNIFLIPITHSNPLRPSYNRDVPRHQNEEFDHHWLWDATVASPPPLTVFEYFDRYQIYFDVSPNRRVQADGNELQVRDCLGKYCYTTVVAWGKRWSHRSSCSALD